jgi:DNA-binding beta-propeller fold protein YncE/ABC-type molybdate transport system permease subunit
MRLSDLCRWLAWLPFLLPGVLLGIALILVFNRPWFALLYDSAGIVILAFVIRYLALGWNSLAHGLQTVDRDLTDAARLDGATRWQMLRYVQWPQVAPQAAAAWYIVFLLCLWDVESMILVVPPGGETLALRVFNLLHYGHNAQVNALCLTLLALAVGPLIVWKAYCVLRVACSAPTQHATRNTILASCAVTLALTGCTPGTPSNQAPLHSRLFRSVQIIGSRGVGVGQLNKPRSVAVDAQDNLYVVDMTGRVQKFSSNGVFLLSWQMPQTDRGKPKGLCRDRDGNIIVLEPHYQRVNVFSPEGKLLAQWGKSGTNAGEFSLPRAVAVDSRGEVFVSEYSVLDRVQRFTARGEKLMAGFGHSGTGLGELNRPEGLCVDAQDRVYVADSCNHRIVVYSRDGNLLGAYGTPGKGKGELSYPYDICVDAAGRQYVCEFGNSRIQVFDANNQPLEIIGGPGLAPGQFNNPWGVALDSAGNLYVADSQNHRVQKLIR